jgi:hypothetical protein
MADFKKTDITERLREKIIADAYEDNRITDWHLAQRLVLDRLDALIEIERLRAELAEAEEGR